MLIVSVRIVVASFTSSVYVTVEGGSEEKLFEYYPDELSFCELEFIGLTVLEASQLKFDRDVRYLRS